MDIKGTVIFQIIQLWKEDDGSLIPTKNKMSFNAKEFKKFVDYLKENEAEILIQLEEKK